MTMTLIEMDGFLRGKCLPGDMKVNETNAEYLVRKFAEAETQLSALTSQLESVFAENAALNQFIKDDCFIYDLDDEQYRDAVDYAAKAPATDAFLAEVRASELDSLAGVAETMLVKFANQGASAIPEAKGWGMIRQQANQRAAKIRQGGTR